MNYIYDQLARSTLLPSSMSVAILAGEQPHIEHIVMTLIQHAQDCEAMIRNDPKASWIDRRIARQVLTIAFLSALLQAREA
jgi:hypothetical protein